MCNGKNTMETKQDCNIELPPGFRFHPTDDELVSFYLTRKVKNPHFAVKSIPNVSLNKCEPWDLPEKAKVGEKEWYFFSLRDRKYPTGIRTNRATDAGYWKATGKDRDVFAHGRPPLVGMKKTLVFYRGRAPKGEKTSWIMHEYRLEGDGGHSLSPRVNKDEWVVCRIFQKNSGGKGSFLFSDSCMRSHAVMYQIEDTRSSLPPVMNNNSPNPTVTDGGTCTDCETCAGTEQMPACYNCVDDFDHGKETNSVMSWINAQSTGMDILQQVGDLNNLSNMLSKQYPVYDAAYEKGMSLSRQLGFTPQVLLQPANMTTPTGLRVTSLRPKTEPSSFSEGEDEAQSIPEGYGYDGWQAEDAEASLYNNNDGTADDSSSPLQSSTGGTELSCLSGSFCSGDHMNNFKYRLQDITALADSGLGTEILGWCC